jgi:hypothetical protein
MCFKYHTNSPQSIYISYIIYTYAKNRVKGDLYMGNTKELLDLLQVREKDKLTDLSLYSRLW